MQAQIGAVTLQGNPTGSTANVAAFTLASLTQSVAPNVTNDMLLIWDSVAGTFKKINPTTIASASVSGVSSIAGNAGAFSLSNGITNLVNDIRLASIAADSVLMNATGGSAIPAGVAVGSCSGASNGLTYNTTSHVFGCNTLVSSVTAGTGLSGGVITTTGTVSVNYATGADYLAGTSSILSINPSVIYQAEVAVTYGTTTAFNFATFNNASVTLTGNITTMNVSNVTAGKSGSIRFIQSSAGSYTSVFNTVFKFGSGTIPTLTSGSTTAVDILNFHCVTATFCEASLNKDVRNP